MKRFLSVLLTVTILVAFSSVEINAQKLTGEAALVAKAKKIHREVITLDTHNDINTANFTETVNYTQNLSTQVNLPKMREGGLDVSWMIVYTGQGELNEAGYQKAFQNDKPPWPYCPGNL